MGFNLESHRKFYLFIFCFFLDFWQICAPKWGKSDENGIYLGGRVQKKFTENFGWKNRARSHLRYYHFHSLVCYDKCNVCTCTLVMALVLLVFW